ncbi:flagellar basal body P-ring formation chaperone FlgA [Pelomonas sp. KK5]|uniref:flagellar basal body P-ring formation chaperone FlgA n=1 Tax=Pelomonas sp. KK5 TaxID=1855730 RepID=UPI001301CA2F|nr:flagellar basal body P-ring formation chaperone FlgA [Pelomonas sp. KK5]
MSFSSRFYSVVLLAGLAGVAHAATLEEQVAEAARAALVEQAQREGLVEPQVQARVLPALGSAAAQRRAAAQCAKPWALQAQDLRAAGRVRVLASCPGSNAPALDFVVKAELSAEVLVAATALPSGRVLAESDLLRERRDVGPDMLSDADAVTGQALRSPLRAGQPISRRQLAEAIVIKRGEAVRIVARNGEIEVQAAGEALDAGARAATIRVRNVNTGRIISARVVGPGEVAPASLAGQ